MKHRVCVAIDLPEELKTRISEMISQWRWLPIRWLPKEQWHVTLLPPRYLTDEELPHFLEHLKAKASFDTFSIRFSRVLLAPPGTSARMVWIEGEAPPEFMKLKNRLEPSLQTNGSSKVWEPSSKLHVTIARFKAGELKELEAKTHVLGEVQFRFTVREVALFESHFAPEGSRYEILAAIPFA